MIPSEQANITYTLILSLVAGTPLILSTFYFLPVRIMKKLLPLGAVPALLAPLIVPLNVVVEVPWFFMGGIMGLDQTGCIFLSLSAFIWLLAGLSAGHLQFHLGAHKRFHYFFLISMAGNFGLIIAQGKLGYYLFFAMMSFAAYGLVIAKNTVQSRKAANLYLTLVIISEVSMFVALILLSQQDTASPMLSDMSKNILHPLVFLFVYIAFGVKIGALPLQGWMVPCYQNTPTPATAALAGAMINAGILGWIRFLPLGEISNSPAGIFFIISGAFAALYGVITGLLNHRPKSILAYSSISQMGEVVH